MPQEGSPTPERQPQAPVAFETRWRQRFQEFAELRDDDAGIAGWSTSGLEARLRHFLAYWHGARARSLWLDAGCGAGTYSRLLARQGAAVVSVDYSPLTINKARARNGGAGIWVVADVAHLPFRREQFDGILCFGVMQALSKSEPAIRELSERLGPGGELWVDALNAWCVPNLWGRLWRRVEGKPMHLRYESPWALRRALRRAGLRKVTLHWMPILPSRFQRLQRLLEHRSVRFFLRWIPFLGLSVSHSFVIAAQRPTGC